MTDLENLLKGSVQILELQKAVNAALPLLRSEQHSFAEILAANKGKSSYALDAIKQQHDEWLAVIRQCEAALKPSEPDVIPKLQCPLCFEDTVGTIKGMCLKCYESLNAMEQVEPCAGVVVEMPRRSQ